MAAYFKQFFKKLGPGLTTGAADDDPSGIATYSQTGAQFGYGQLWTALFMLPLIIAVQEACARVGAVNGEGVAAVIKKNYSSKILYVIVMLLLVANTINIGADIGAMAAALHLLVPVNFAVLTLLFTAVILILEIFIQYRRYANILKWLCLSLIAYPLTVFIIDVPWATVMKATFVPHIQFDFQFLFIITGVLGTTISPYLFIWQASQEVEEEKDKGLIKESGKPHISKQYIRNLRIDTCVGMIFSEIATWSIIVVGAAVLHTNGITTINSAADAAKALEPLVHGFPAAGFLTKLIFCIGIIGLGMLSVPVLAGSTAYAMSEAFSWKKGLSLKLRDAHGFYGVITIATVIGLCINFVGIDPFRALVYAAVINGVIAVPMIFIIALVARNEKIMGKYKSGWLSNTFVWLTFICMSVAAIAMFFSFSH
ncbi:MAG: divalent metal cation transporter [Gammaproteobacteria bacterium]|nr:divalent metal cation transporter [Gammaproteobacteria bacterium]